MARIDYLGHAGFIVEHEGARLLMDPWFYPAFLGSWFPYPDNRFLAERVAAERFDYLYVSHSHEDHFDRRFLAVLPKNIRVLCPDYRTRGMQKRFKALGFTRVIPLSHMQSLELAPDLRVTMYLDTGHKEDSALLVEAGGFRFFDMNDCNTPLSQLPADIDLLAAQYSGAMWYPNCYDYPAPLMREKVARVRQDAMDTLVRKCKVTGARTYLPSAGPACFLDPALMHFDDRDTTIFPIWENVESAFTEALPDVSVVRAYPGDALRSAGHDTTLEPAHGQHDEDLAAYSARRRDEWAVFAECPDRPIDSAEISAYFTTLQRRNKHLLHDFNRTIRLAADQQVWTVHLGQLAQDFVIDGEEPYDPQYTLLMSSGVLRAILDGDSGWEEALLSMRVHLQRKPDVFDSRLIGLLRYGNEPVQTLQMSREMVCDETIERDGLRMQRYCPHAGEDLTFATICNGVIECPRHHWKWNAQTGECLEGGRLPLRVEPADEPAAACELPATACGLAAATCVLNAIEQADNRI